MLELTDTRINEDSDVATLEWSWGDTLTILDEQDMSQAIEDGEIDPDNLHESAFAYACREAIFIDDDDAPRILALAEHLEEYPEYLDVSSYDYQILTQGNREYIVVDDEEADELWDEALDNYLDECVLLGLPKTAQNYFDRKQWKRDARIDGRGHSLGRYDGCEYESREFFIYRQN